MKQFLLLGFIVAAAVPCLLKAGDESGFRSFRERYSIAGDEGVVAYPRGTQVLVLSEKNGVCTVKIGERTLDVEASKLTSPPLAAAAVSATSTANEEVTFSSKEAEPMVALAPSSSRSPSRPTQPSAPTQKTSGNGKGSSASTVVNYGSIVILNRRRPIVRWPYFPYYPSPSYKIVTKPSAYDWHQWSSLSATEETEESADPVALDLDPQPADPPAPRAPLVISTNESGAKIEPKTRTLRR